MGWSWSWISGWWRRRRRAQAGRLTPPPRRRVQEGTLLPEPEPEEGPVRHASPETRAWVEALTRRWPARERVTFPSPDTISWLGILTGQPGVHTVTRRDGKRMQVTVDEAGNASAVELRDL